ncbi:MAG: phosphopentomutase [Elusimicrobia bacterium]|nr:phosphopentomutase [Elusimicrobiota bacterium]
MNSQEKIKRAIIIVMDSLGIGAMPDADRFNDAGVNTLLHIHRDSGGLKVPNLRALGMGKLVDLGAGGKELEGCYGRLSEASPNKDTTTGHWELAGLVMKKAFPTYPDGFPQELIKEYEKRIGTGTLGNYARSGTEILKELGEEHYNTGFPIVYTSADSVFQIAAHEEVFGLDRLYEICRIAREMLVGDHPVARVIARPFRGKPGSFERNNAGRKDYSVQPPSDTLLDILKKSGMFVAGVGKIGDIFGHRGLTEEIKAPDNMGNVDLTVKCIREHAEDMGLIFTNLVDFDMVYGHRRDTQGYAGAIEEFDSRLPEIMGSMAPEDVLIITADHGCDPTHSAHTDHTREYVPLLVYGKALKKGVDLGTRQSFADCGQTVSDMLLGEQRLSNGNSFKKDIL